MNIQHNRTASSHLKITKDNEGKITTPQSLFISVQVLSSYPSNPTPHLSSPIFPPLPVDQPATAGIHSRPIFSEKQVSNQCPKSGKLFENLPINPMLSSDITYFRSIGPLCRFPSSYPRGMSSVQCYEDVLLSSWYWAGWHVSCHEKGKERKNKTYLELNPSSAHRPVHGQSIPLREISRRGCPIFSERNEKDKLAILSKSDKLVITSDGPV